MKYYTITFCTLFITSTFVNGQIIYSQSYPGHQEQSYIPQQISLANRAVVENSLVEAQLPPELTNKFYKNPRIAEALAKESWFTNKEMPVFEREAEKIPREQIYKLFRNAGFIKRRR